MIALETYGPSSTPAVEINSDWRSILLKAVTDALASSSIKCSSIHSLLRRTNSSPHRKNADPGLKFLIGYLAQSKPSRHFDGVFFLQNDHAHHPIGSYDAFNSILLIQQQLLTENTEIKGQLELIRTHITQQPSLTDTEGGNPEVKAPLDLFISTLAGQGQPA
ncbi:hypothetical protein PSHT_15674 [Puccinia striiformis]|uniref:Uncharacterized protein n=1 Tax=Puccinia striiformis TaxID=27350 RepID=A0A2S4UE04_9BASI|nr:hypothetical protein PSHT_15674 [Puccinia striiformis]